MDTARDRITVAVAGLRRSCGQPAGPTRRGPVLLNVLFEEQNLSHIVLPDLTRGAVAAHLRAEGLPVEDFGDPGEKLAGFVFVAGRIGWAFVTGADSVPRRRFTAAHELGHFVLHRETMGRFQADTKQSVLEDAEPDTAALMEREANRFAAELLMPEEVCRARADALRREYGCCPRTVLAYRLAAELLVSREAVRYRLKGLEVGDE
jgi:hypothetical protein